MTPFVDFDDFVVQELPPDHRTPFFIAWVRGLISQLKRLYNIMYGFMTYSAIEGTAPDYYDSSTSYTYDDEVIYNYQVYKSLSSPNSNNTPDLSPNDWQLIINNFIGLLERARYSFQKIVLEWALNHYFHHEISLESLPGFIQPDDPINPTNSTIFINSLTPDYSSFVSYGAKATSSIVYLNSSSEYVFSEANISTSSSYVFEVNIPTDVYTNINADAGLAEKIVRQFLDKYIPAGITYNIITY